MRQLKSRLLICSCRNFKRVSDSSGDIPSIWRAIVGFTIKLILNLYAQKELGKRLAIFRVSSMAGNMFLGVLQAALYKNLNGAHGLEGWQWLVILSGIITIAWGFIGFFAIPDSHSYTRAPYLSKSERALAHTRMSDTGTTAELFVADFVKTAQQQSRSVG